MSEDEKKPAPDLFPFDEMSTGVASSLQRRANYITGKPEDLPAEPDPALKPRTGAYYAFRPSAPPAPKAATGTALNPAFKPGNTGATPALKPGTGTTPAYKPGTGATPAYKPGTGTTPAFKPGGTGSHPAMKTGSFAPIQPREDAPALGEEDDSKLQTHLRALALSDPAGLTVRSSAPRRPPKLPPSAAEDTFVKRKMKEAEKNVPDFDLDEDLG